MHGSDKYDKTSNYGIIIFWISIESNITKFWLKLDMLSLDVTSLKKGN